MPQPRSLAALTALLAASSLLAGCSLSGGGSDEAGFVQIMEGRSPDVRRMHEIMDQAGDQIQRMRPEIIGAVIADTTDGRYVDAVYFTSEAEARQHEAMDMPDNMRALFDEQTRLMGKVAYFDLHRPMLVSPSV